ncbi:hypothetical protein FAZ15_16335 [Sphingobacterium olei]|uniref:RHS repeat protein n=1 Tax=Sphingobacterium olei TaxID=2571155 RepID=A0A4U0NHB3_9SPHI|nr:hypothetical protein [Sphingobacterium olei]TJZ53601.1 hypothetical protein FAZ15_16335 [Sphingobacterium olei]
MILNKEARPDLFFFSSDYAVLPAVGKLFFCLFKAGMSFGSGFWTVFILTWLFTPLGGRAQSLNLEVRPSVNAQQFMATLAKGSSNLQTGQPSVTIPLLDVRSGGISIPITMSFNGAGVIGETEASHIGLGWSLMAGGALLRSIRGTDDTQRHPSSSLAWHYDQNYIADKWYEQESNTFSSNKFVDAMGLVSSDPEPDDYTYSFMGYSGDICFYDPPNGPSSTTLYPDRSFRLEKTSSGYKIYGADATVYYFESEERKSDYTIAWFLTRISGQNGSNVYFSYESESCYDLSQTVLSTYMVQYSKRLTRIDYEDGYILFTAGDRADMPSTPISGIDATKSITHISQYDSRDSLVRGFEMLYQDGYFTNEVTDSYGGGESYANYRLRLSGVREFGPGGSSLPPYRFGYDYSFFLSKRSYISDPFNTIRTGAWAHNPTLVAMSDRGVHGEHSPWVVYNYVDSYPEGYYIPSIRGWSASFDLFSSSVRDYLCLTSIQYPAGGREEMVYERHSYGNINNSQDTVGSSAYVDQRDRLTGKRLKSRTVQDGLGFTYYAYRYHLHGPDYEQLLYHQSPVSSGVLINPTIYTTAQYESAYDHSRPRLRAVPHSTKRPQNSFMGSPVFYREVEEERVDEYGHGSQGKRIYYFESMYAIPPVNYVYRNYLRDGSYFLSRNSLTPIPNTIYGKQQYLVDPEIDMSDHYMTYLAYPLGRFMQARLGSDRLLKEVVLSGTGEIVRKTEHRYSEGISAIKYGLAVVGYDDNDYQVSPYPDFEVKRYLISHSQRLFSVRQLVGTTVTDYHPTGTYKDSISYHYTFNNIARGMGRVDSDGQETVTRHTYADEIVFHASSGLSVGAQALARMKEVNMVNVPVQTTVRRGTDYIDGSYTAFRQLSGGIVVPDSTFRLETEVGTAVATPNVGTTGNIHRSAAFTLESSYPSYDGYANPLTAVGRSGVPETIIRGYNGRHPVAHFSNYTYAQVQGNSALQVQLSQLEGYRTVDGSDRAALEAVNQAIRSSLPAGVLVTTYTYDPHVGQTTACDARGLTSYYSYDALGRLSTVRDHNGDIVKQYCYNYKDQPQPCDGMPLPGGGGTVIYVKMDLLNPQTLTGAGYVVELADVIFGLYSDAACTQPHFLTAPLTITTALRTTMFYNGESSFLGESSSQINFAVGSSEWVGTQLEQGIYIEVGTDPVLGSIYEVYLTEFIVLPGEGYEVAQ